MHLKINIESITTKNSFANHVTINWKKESYNLPPLTSNQISSSQQSHPPVSDFIQFPSNRYLQNPKVTNKCLCICCCKDDILRYQWCGFQWIMIWCSKSHCKTSTQRTNCFYHLDKNTSATSVINHWNVAPYPSMLWHSLY